MPGFGDPKHVGARFGLTISKRDSGVYECEGEDWPAAGSVDGAVRRSHVWTTPADQGFFCRVAMVVGAVMSPAWLCGDKMRPAGPDVVRVIPGPIKVSRSRSADNASGLGMGPQSLASRHSHPRFLVSRNRPLYA